MLPNRMYHWVYWSVLHATPSCPPPWNSPTDLCWSVLCSVCLIVSSTYVWCVWLSTNAISGENTSRRTRDLARWIVCYSTQYKPLTELRRESMFKASDASAFFGTSSWRGSALGNTSSTLGHDNPAEGNQQNQPKGKVPRLKRFSNYKLCLEPQSDYGLQWYVKLQRLPSDRKFLNFR